MRHIHADLIKAWADGAQIQFRTSNSNWADLDHCPSWNTNWEYRIKPEPKQDLVCEARIIPCLVYPGTVLLAVGPSNVEFTFDGETEELKSAEVIK